MDSKELVQSQIDSLEGYLDVFGNIMPGGVGIVKVEDDTVTPLYLSQGITYLCQGFDDDFYKEIEKNPISMFYDNEVQKVKDAFFEASSRKGILDITVRYKKTPRKKGWLWIRARKMKCEDECIFHMMVLDVTQQKELESEIKIQQERYRILEETSDYILFQVDRVKDEMTYSYKELDGSIIKKRVPRYLRTLDEQDIIHPDYLQIFKEHMKIAFDHETEGKLEYMTRISGNGYEWHRVHYCSIMESSGEINRIIGRIKNVHDEVINRQRNTDLLASGVYAFGGIQRQIHDSLENSDFNQTHVMVILSINHFKTMNGQHCVSWGDAAMQRIKEVIEAETKGKAVYGQVSDGKILMYFKDIEPEMVDEMIENILGNLEHPDNKLADDIIHCSVGAAKAQGVADYATFYHEVEEALHIAKITHGERYVRV